VSQSGQLLPLIPKIPEYLAGLAIAKGVPAEEVDTVWTEYVDWSLREYPNKELGGPSWERQCERSAKRYKTLTQDQKGALDAAREAREGAQEQQRRRDEAYRKQAVSFEDYARLVRQKDPTGLSLNPVERSIVAMLERRGDRPFEFHDWTGTLPDQFTGSPEGKRWLNEQRQKGYPPT
jgi:hypothetical protein